MRTIHCHIQQFFRIQVAMQLKPSEIMGSLFRENSTHQHVLPDSIPSIVAAFSEFSVGLFADGDEISNSF